MKRNDLNITAVDFIAGAAVVALIVVAALTWIDCRTSKCPEGMKPVIVSGQCACVTQPW